MNGFTADNYINIQGWMICELGLKGNELIAYAIVYGFSQNGESEYKGSAKYIAEALQISVKTARKLLDSLCDRGLLTKRLTTNDTGNSNRYKVTPNPREFAAQAPEGREESSLGVGKKVPGGREESSLGVGKKVPPSNNNIIINNNIYNNSLSGASASVRVIEVFNETCKSLPRVTLIPDRRKAIRNRLKTFSLEQLSTAFQKAERSDFLTGRARADGKQAVWTASFDWIMRDDKTVAAVLEGNYDNRTAQRGGDTGKNRFHNFNQRDYDYDELEKQMLASQW